MKNYHVALIDNDNLPYGYNSGRASNTVTVQLRESKDCLAPYIWQYIGERCVTKKSIREKKSEWLTMINATYNKSFTALRID